MRQSLDLLAEFMLDTWLVARFSPQRGGAALDGRTWERAVSGLLYRPGFSRRQGPGTLTLFGSPSASGIHHEIDSAADSRHGSFIVECKATAVGISKSDVALFHFKVMDFYQRNLRTASRESWWPILCGVTSTPNPARAAAVSLGLLVCDRDRLPLPVLVRAAGRPSADMYLPEALLQEIVRLGERAMRPFQELWPYRARPGEISFNPYQWKPGEIDDLLWLEGELSDSVLDLYERYRPGALERRARNLIWQVRKVA